MKDQNKKKEGIKMDFISNLKSMQKEVRTEIKHIECHTWNLQWRIDKSLSLMNTLSTINSVILPLTYGSSKNKEVENIYEENSDLFREINKIFDKLMEERA
jgi:hypothetical protein